jgi:hypothetical protein
MRQQHEKQLLTLNINYSISNIPIALVMGYQNNSFAHFLQLFQNADYIFTVGFVKKATAFHLGGAEVHGIA